MEINSVACLASVQANLMASKAGLSVSWSLNKACMICCFNLLSTSLFSSTGPRGISEERYKSRNFAFFTESSLSHSVLPIAATSTESDNNNSIALACVPAYWTAEKCFSASLMPIPFSNNLGTRLPHSRGRGWNICNRFSFCPWDRDHWNDQERSFL